MGVANRTLAALTPPFPLSTAGTAVPTTRFGIIVVYTLGGDVGPTGDGVGGGTTLGATDVGSADGMVVPVAGETVVGTAVANAGEMVGGLVAGKLGAEVDGLLVGVATGLTVNDSGDTVGALVGGITGGIRCRCYGRWDNRSQRRWRGGSEDRRCRWLHKWAAS